jgi:hypothetical protein
MVSILDYDELSLLGLDIEPIELRVERLKASFGSGYGASAAVGHPSGLWGWEIGAEVLADDASYVDQIEGLPSFEYYRQFYLDHTVGDAGEIFQIDFRGRKFHCAFSDDSISGSMHTYDLFSLSGVKLEMRRVPGIYYLDDGSIFDPRDVPNLYGWWRAEDYDGEDWPDLAHGDNPIFFTRAGDVIQVLDVQNGRPVVRLNSLASTGLLSPSGFSTMRIYAALFVMAMRETPFSNNAGILTGSGGSSAKILAGTSTTTKFANQAIGGSFQYALNGTNHAESDEQAPMDSEFGIVSVTGVGTDVDPQIGKSRNTAGTFAKADIGEIIIIGGAASSSPANPSATNLANLIAFLRRGWATP